MTEKKIARDQLRAVAHRAEQANSAVYLAPRDLLALLDLLGQLDQAEAELDSWMTRAYEAEGKLWKAEARIRHLEDTARVLVKEVLDAENARDESRRGKAEAEARIKAVEDVLNTVEDGHSTDPVIRGLFPRMVGTALIRRALDGDA